MNANDEMKINLAHLEDQVAELRAALKKLPDLGDVSAYLSTICFQAFIPYNLTTANEIKEKLEAAGWEEVERHNRIYAGDAVIVFKYPGIARVFEIVMEPERFGSTCKRQVISYDKTPIYEIVCNEQAGA